MFDFLYEALAYGFNGILKAIKIATSGIVQHVFNVWGLLTTLLAVVLTIVTNAAGWFAEGLEALQGVHDEWDEHFGNGNGSVGFASWPLEILERANGVFPVAELVGYGVALGAIHTAFLVYRFVKSWVPTVSG